MKAESPAYIRQGPLLGCAGIYQPANFQECLNSERCTPPAIALRRGDGGQEVNRGSFLRRPAPASQAGRRVEEPIPLALRRPALLLREPMDGSFTATKTLRNLRGGEKCLAARHAT